MEQIKHFIVVVFRLVTEMTGALIWGIVASIYLGPYLPNLPKYFQVKHATTETMVVAMIAVVLLYKLIGAKGLMGLGSRGQ